MVDEALLRIGELSRRVGVSPELPPLRERLDGPLRQARTAGGDCACADGGRPALELTVVTGTTRRRFTRVRADLRRLGEASRLAVARAGVS